MNTRVVITGAGVVSPLGNTLAATLDALALGTSAVRPATGFDASGVGESLAAEVRDFDPRPSFIAPKALKMTDRAAQFAVVAARAALDGSRWQPASHLRPLGVVMGTSGHDLLLPELAAAIGTDEAQRAVGDTAWCGERLRAGLPPLWLLTVLPNMISAHVAMQTDASGPCSTLMSSDASGLQAIGEAAEWIRYGEADAVLAGASDTAINPFVCMALAQAGLTQIPAEGAAAFLVERADHAEARGAEVLADVLAYASRMAGADGCHRAVEAACAEAGISIDQVRCTTGDVRFDHSTHVDVSPQLGHALAAAAPITLAVALAQHSTAAAGAYALATVRGTNGPSVAIVLRTGPRKGIES